MNYSVDLFDLLVKLHSFTAVASPWKLLLGAPQAACDTGFLRAKSRTDIHSSMGSHPWFSGAWVKGESVKELVGRKYRFI